MQTLRALWAYRGFILGSVKREFQAKYHSSLLGFAWMVLNPLAMIAIYTVIFSSIMQTRLPGVSGTFAYSIYLCAGILTWGLFSEIVGRSLTSFIDNANLIKKLTFPKLCLPVIIVLSGFVNFGVVFGLFTLFLLITGTFPGLPFLALLPLLAIQALFAVGLGMTLAVFNVFFRDVGQLFSIVLSFWFWFTPIVYPISILPAWAAPLMAYNPMARLVGAYQEVLVTAAWPDWQGILPVLMLGLLLCAAGLGLLRRNASDLVDEL